MTIREILERKGRGVVTVSPEATVLDAVGVLVEHRIGAAVVTEGDDVVGIVSERDVLNLTAERSGELGTIRVGDVMSSDVVVGEEGDSLSYVMEILTRNRIRHLPVVAGGSLTGIVSIGDVVNALRDEVEAENRYLKSYIRGGTY